MGRRVFPRLFAYLPVLALCASSASATGQATERLVIRGHLQTLHLYGPAGGAPVVVSSGDGGWIHLGPHVAEVLAAAGYFVVGLDAKAYLTSYTTGTTTLSPADEPGDFAQIAAFAGHGSSKKPILVGVSEGAGLSVPAASEPRTKATIAGVIGIGLPDLTELGWRWRDSLIYLTHKVPNEPTFSTAAVIARVAPLPVGLIQATHDEFVPLETVTRILSGAGEPKRLWIVPAANHRFSDNEPEFDRRLLEAVAWVQARAPR